MTASGTIKPDFDLTNEMLEEIGSVLKKLYETRPDIKVSLDLSEQTQITKIGFSAFSGCANLTSINIPDSVTLIDDCAFEGCTSLTDVLIPNAVNTIRLSAFKNCANLTSINIPDSVTEIGDYAFNGCSSLESIAIPLVGNNINDTVDGGSSVFAQIFGSSYHPAANNSNIPTSLKSVTVNSGIIPDYAFKDCSSIESIVIKGNPAKIGSSAFSGCTSLTSINIPDSVTEIGSSAFSGCSKLSKINIPTNVSKIGWTTFENCTSLTDVLIPNAITEIGWGAFENCENLTSINIPASVIKIYSNTFSGCEKLTIKIEDENSTWNYEYYKDSTKITGKTRLVNFNLVYWSKVNNGSSVATLTKIIQ